MSQWTSFPLCDYATICAETFLMGLCSKQSSIHRAFNLHVFGEVKIMGIIFDLIKLPKALRQLKVLDKFKYDENKQILPCWEGDKILVLCNVEYTAVSIGSNASPSHYDPKEPFGWSIQKMYFRIDSLQHHTYLVQTNARNWSQRQFSSDDLVAALNQFYAYVAF